jgi:cyclomaltodextrinase
MYLRLCRILPHMLMASAVVGADNRPIWPLGETPSPFPIVRLVPGESARVSLFKATPFRNFRVVETVTDHSVGRIHQADQDAITIQARSGYSGMSALRIVIEAEDGTRDEIAIPVVVEDLPLIDFHYAPAFDGVQRVALAGSFNGWSDSADLLTRSDDGVFRITKAIHPGTYSYKFVVDGEWMADPANPETDGSGFGNSLLRVAGNVEETFEFEVLSAVMPGVGPQGGFYTDVPLDPDKMMLILNNKRRDRGEVVYDEASGILSLQVPEGDWMAENHATLFAESLDGRSGIVGAHFITAEAPRSPRDEVIYFAMTDRFFDGNPGNNPPRQIISVHPNAEYHGGDWAGITQMIEKGYFSDLGITTLWISPPNENTPKVEKESVPPGNYFTSYHGYWPTSFMETNPPFGTMDDLRALVNTAHVRGIAVLLDFVSNHVHEEHPLFQSDPGIAVPLQLPSGEDNIRKFNEYPFTTWFDTFLPTLDYEGRPDLIPIMSDSALHWLRETNADGFRHDAVKHVPLPFWRELTRRLHDEIEIAQQRKVYQVGETISSHATIAKFVGPDMLDGQFDFPTYFTIQNVIARGEGAMKDIAQALTDGQRIYPPSAIMSPLLGNHDMGRFMAYADGDLPAGADENHIAFHTPPTVDNPDSYDRLYFGFALLAALEGPPTIYYGDELGMTGASDPDNRRPMKWDDWSDIERATFEHVAALNHVRAESTALRRGVMQVLHADDEHLVLARIAPEQVMIAAYFRRPIAESLTIALPGPWHGLSLQSLKLGEISAYNDDASVTFRGPYWSWGFWEVTWPR